MRATALVKSLPIIGAVLALSGPIAVAAAASPTEMSASQILKPADLTPQEVTYYKQLSNPEEAKHFIVTRSYERLCQQVVDRKLPPSQLPGKPVGFSVKYLLPAEPNVINRAIALVLNPQAVFLEMSASQILKPTDLAPGELEHLQTLTDRAEAKMFVETRSYVRLCKMVVEKRLPATQLPTKPLGFINDYVLPQEKAAVDQAIAESAAAAMRGLR